MRLDGEIFCTSLKEVSERRAKRGKKERRNRYESYRSWTVALIVWKVIDFSHLIKNIMVTHSESHSEPSQTSRVELFTKIVNGSKSLIVFARSFILDDWLGSEYACFVRKIEHSFLFPFRKKTLVRLTKTHFSFFILYGALCQEISRVKLGRYEYQLIVYLQAIVSFFSIWKWFTYSEIFCNEM